MSSKQKNNKNIDKPKLNNLVMKDVFDNNFHEEISRLGACLETYKYIAMVYIYKYFIKN